MDILLTTCTARKRPVIGLIPAEYRYLGPRVEWCKTEAARANRALYFFSGLYGIISGDALIPWYDRVLPNGPHPELERSGMRRLMRANIRSVVLVLRPRETPGWAPYWETIESILRKADMPREVWLTELE
jgi:hypothetical protein